MENKTIKYVSGVCGSGKTHSTVKHHATFCRSQKTHLINTSPSIKLVSQTFDMFREAKYNDVKEIHSGNQEYGSVQANILRQLSDDLSKETAINCITAQAFIDLPYIPRKDKWDIVIDEIPQADKFFKICAPYNHNIFTRFLTVSEVKYVPSLYRVALNDCGKRILARNKDAVDDIYRDLFKSITRGDEVYCSVEEWDKLVGQNDITNDHDVDMEFGNKKNTLFFLSLLTETPFLGFKSTTFLGANIEQSLLYQVWQKRGINWEEHTQIKRKLRYKNNWHKNGKRLRISYLTDKNNSKAALNNQNFGSLLDRYVEAHFTAEKKKYLYVCNKDHEEEWKVRYGESEFARPMSVLSHGLNNYDDYNAIYFGPALNREPKHIAMLTALGFDATLTQRCTAHETAYQNLMRTSLRDPEAKGIVECIVVDKATAESIARLFPGCSIGEAGFAAKVVRRSKEVLSQNQYNRRSRLQKRLKTLGLLEQYGEISVETGAGIVPTSVIADEHFSENGDCKSLIFQEVSGFMYTNTEPVIPDILHKNQGDTNSDSFNMYKDQGDTNSNFSTDRNFLPILSDIENIHTPETRVNQFQDLGQLRKLLKDFSKVPIPDKAYFKLINGTLFDPKKCDETQRGLNNAIYNGLIILDIDNGDMTPRDFEDIVRPLKISVDIMNTFSRTPEKPNMYRVYIWLKSLVDNEGYKAISEDIIEECRRNGFYTGKNAKDNTRLHQMGYKLSGIDRSKNKVCDFFYPPCINQYHPEMAFWIEVNTGTARELKKYILDPVEWLGRKDDPTFLEPLEYEQSIKEFPRTKDITEYNETRLEQAKVKWGTVPIGQKVRNHEHYKIACSIYHYTGMDANRTETILNELVRDSKERGRIPDIMKSMRTLR